MLSHGAMGCAYCTALPKRAMPVEAWGAAALIGLGVIGDTLSYGEQTVLLPSPTSGILGRKGVRP